MDFLKKLLKDQIKHPKKQRFLSYKVKTINILSSANYNNWLATALFVLFELLDVHLLVFFYFGLLKKVPAYEKNKKEPAYEK